MQIYNALTGGDGSPEQPWALYDQTADGARIRVASPSALPTEFALTIDHSLTRHCVVVWRSEKEAGIKFKEIADPLAAMARVSMFWPHTLSKAPAK